MQSLKSEVLSVCRYTETETDINETKCIIFCRAQKGGTRTFSQSLVCEKDVNALLIIVIQNSPRKLSWTRLGPSNKRSLRLRLLHATRLDKLSRAISDDDDKEGIYVFFHR